MDVAQTRADIIKSVLRDSVYHEASGEVFAFCVNGCHATKRKLQINVKKNIFKCWVCSYSGSIFKFLKAYATVSQREQYFRTLDNLFSEQSATWRSAKILDLPSSFCLLQNNTNSPLGRKSVEYLESNNIDINFAIQNKVGYCTDGEFANMIVFLSFDRNGKLNFYQGRNLFNIGKKYHSCEQKSKDIVFNEFLLNYSKQIILVESVKSFLRHKTIENIVPILGSTLRDNYYLFQELIINNCPKVVVALDPDAKIKSLKITQEFAKHGVEVLFADIKKKQPDEMDTNEFIECIKSGSSINKVDFIKELLRSV